MVVKIEMLSHISASISLSYSSLAATASPTALRRLRPSLSKSLRPELRSYPFKLLKRHSIFSMETNPSTTASVSSDSISDDKENKTLEHNSVKNSNRVKLKLEELRWDNSFVRELPGDPRTDLIPRQVRYLFNFIYSIVSGFIYSFWIFRWWYFNFIYASSAIFIKNFVGIVAAKSDTPDFLFFGSLRFGTIEQWGQLILRG